MTDQAANALIFRAAGDPAPPGAWASLLDAMQYWPSPARITVERRLTRAGRGLSEHVIVHSDALGILDAESEALEDLLRPLRTVASLRRVRSCPPALTAATAHLPEIGRGRHAPAGERLGDFLDELARLPAGSGFSLTASTVPPAEDEGDDDPLRVSIPMFDFEVDVRRPVAPPLDATARLWSPAPLPAALLARAGAAFGHQPSPSPGHSDDDRARLSVTHLARVLAAPGLTPPDPGRRARLGRPHTGRLPREGAPLGRVLTPSGATRPFLLPWDQRRRHVFLCGRTGSGKSELIARLVDDDLASGRGVVLIDPHGDLADRVLALVPPERRDDVVLIDPTDRRGAAIPVIARAADAAARATAFDDALIESLDGGQLMWSSRTRRPARFALEVLDHLPGVDPTLANLDRMLAEDDVRKGLALALQDTAVGGRLAGKPRMFWDHGTARGAIFSQSPGRYAFDHLPRWDLDRALRNRGIVIARLDQAQLGLADTERFGRILLSLVQRASTGLADLPPDARPQLSLIVDEAHLFTQSQVLGSMLSQLRKFGAALTLCTQTPSRLGGLLPDVLTNCATVMAMQLPKREASTFSERGGEALVERIAALPRFHAAMLLDDDDDPRPLVLHPAAPLNDDPAARAAALATAQRRHGRDPKLEDRGDLSRFAELVDELDERSSSPFGAPPRPDTPRAKRLIAAALHPGRPGAAAA